MTWHMWSKHVSSGGIRVPDILPEDDIMLPSPLISSSTGEAGLLGLHADEAFFRAFIQAFLP